MVRYSLAYGQAFDPVIHAGASENTEDRSAEEVPAGTGWASIYATCVATVAQFQVVRRAQRHCEGIEFAVLQFCSDGSNFNAPRRRNSVVKQRAVSLSLGA